MINIDLAAQAALWYQQLCDSNNAKFVPLFFDEHRYLVLMGGGGSGGSRRRRGRCRGRAGASR